MSSKKSIVILSKLNRRRITQIIPFGIISLLFGLTYSLIEYGILGSHSIYPSTGNPYHFRPLSSILLSLLAGLAIGACEVLFLNKRFNSKGFFMKIVYKTSIYVLLIAILICIISAYNHASELRKSMLDPQVLALVSVFFKSFAFWSMEIYFALAIAVSLFYTEVSENIGQAVLANFLTGKYHKPLEEERIFMFLDMKDSTSIAEELGHVKYFDLLREYYKDLTAPIVQYGGQIYQYVGDEVVVSWKKKQGISSNACIKCFFRMKSSLISQASKYTTKYGIVPSFKAGIHLGKVTTGEIGVVKKEIAFSGDVLNTTARIQGLCNQYKTELLISKQLNIQLESSEEFQQKEIGEVELRGKDEKIYLYAVKQS